MYCALHDAFGRDQCDRSVIVLNLLHTLGECGKRTVPDHWAHRPWQHIIWLQEQFVRQGKILYVGSSNFGALHIAQAQHAASTRNFLGLVSEQSVYNLRRRMVELEVVPACREYGLGLIPWSPLDGGMLAGILQKVNEGRRAGGDVQERVEKYRNQLEAYEALCKEIGESPADVALAWLLNNPVVTAPIVGPRTIEQLDGNIQSLELKLTDDVLSKLDEIWPGPGGEAPEAYAW